MQKTIITLSVLTLILPGLWISPSAFGRTNTKILTIRQEPYTFKMEVTQTVTTDTFVITESDTENGKKTYSKTADKYSGKNALKSAVLATCLFQFDSPVLVPSETDKILTILSKKNLEKTPLAVTGYTCSLGPAEHNQTLSLQRAKAVAGFLRKHGFTVATVQGKGSQNPVTNDPRQFHLNRRVTVQVQVDKRKK